MVDCVRHACKLTLPRLDFFVENLPLSQDKVQSRSRSRVEVVCFAVTIACLQDTSPQLTQASMTPAELEKVYVLDTLR